MPRPPTSRTVQDILWANVVTRFNAILGGLLVVILVVGPPQDALFGVVLVSNTLIGVVQELRAKRSLDQLALLQTPRARVERGDEVVEIAVDDVLAGDVLVVDAGDQIVVDGAVVAEDHLEIDESLLTGESDPVAKDVGDEVLSGSFVVAGSGRYRATRVGDEAYAAALAAEARAFQLVRSELRVGINRILVLVTWLLLPTAVLLVSSQLATHDDLPEALRSSVAGVGAMIPEGLVLLTSLAFAAGVVRLGRRRVLIQELAALELLARVDIVCVDKTGTLTEGDLAVGALEPLSERTDDEVRAALGAVAAAEPRPNATLQAIAAIASPGIEVHDRVPFSSARKWSAADLGERGSWVLGAPEVLVAGGEVLERADVHASAGARVLVFAAAPRGLAGEVLPVELEPAALVVLHDRIRPEARATLDYFADQGVTVKVLSGDHAATVGAVAGALALGDGTGVDARHLPESQDDLADIMETAHVFGRVSPHQKRSMIAALRSRGHVVAMAGDGVNDVLALKEADLGIAMASGSPASRAVAPVVLLDDSFAPLPMVVAEGRRVIANVERVANLFVTKTVYAFLLALAVGVARLPFPFLPRHLTIVSSLTIGIPAFFLALAPNPRRAHSGFVVRVLRFAIPAGVVTAAATFVVYGVARVQKGIELGEARTAATIVLFAVTLWVLDIIARPLTRPRQFLLGAMVVLFVGVIVIPGTSDFFALDLPDAVVTLDIIAVVGLALFTLEAGWRASRWLGGRMSAQGHPPK